MIPVLGRMFTKMFVLIIEWRKICKGFDTPYRGQPFVCLGCSFPNCCRRGGATIPLLSVLSPPPASCPSTSIPELDYQLTPMKHTLFFSFFFSFLLTARPHKHECWHKKGSRGKLRAIV